MSEHATAARTEHEDRAGFWAVWGFGLFAFCLALVLAALTGGPGEVPPAWLLSTIGFTWMTMSWRGVTPERSLLLAVNALLLVGLSTVLWLAEGVPAWESARAGLGLLLQVTVTAAAYRWLREAFGSAPQEPVPGAARWRDAWAAEWAPSSVADLLALAVAPAVSALAVLPVGAIPGISWDGTSGADATAWVVTVTVTCFVGGATTLLSFSRWSRSELAQPVLPVVAMLVLSIALLWWVLESGAVPLSWLVLLPSLYVAFASSVWLTSVYALALGLGTLAVRPPADHSVAFDAVVPLAGAMEMLVSTCVLVALSIAFLLESRARLVSEVERARTRATRQTEVLRAIFESMQDGIVVLGPDRELRMHNAAAVRLLGREMPTERPDSWVDYFGITHVDGRPAREEDLGAVEYLAVTVHGRRRVLHERATFLKSPPEDGLVVYFSDATAEHERLRELRGFAGVVAHDLRAPLTSVEGWLEMALESFATAPDREPAAEDREARGMLERARQGTRRMREVIEDWLGYTVERDGTVQPSDFALASPINVVVANLVGRGPHHFTVDAPHRVHADPALVRQLLDNVIGNASKYTPAGAVPEIRVISAHDSPGWVRIEVADRGIGLPEGEEERIFEEYRRGSGVSDEFVGTGLGLALCRRIVERHGGRITARTNEHGGATVSFTLPAAR